MCCRRTCPANRHLLGESLAILRDCAPRHAGDAHTTRTICIPPNTHQIADDVINSQICNPCDVDCAGDGHGHGTHCAGTIAGTTYGVAKSATVVAVKVLSDEGSGSRAGVVAGMDWVRAQKVADPSTTMVVSMSLGGSGQSLAYETAIDALWAAGVVTSVAAGNDNDDACNYSPAFVPNAITVGSTTSSDARSSFSNCKGRSMHRNCPSSTPAVVCAAQLCDRHSDVAHPCRATAAGHAPALAVGSCVDLYGPGSSITSISHTSDTGTAVKSGTSMACPHVSGVLALIGARNPGYSAAQTRAALLDAAVNGILTNGATPNIMLQSLPIGSTPPPTAPLPAPECTLAPAPPTAIPANFQGDIACGNTVTGDTSTVGSIVGNPAPDHYYVFTVPAGPDAQITFDACASGFDTWIRIFNGFNPTTSTEVAGCDDCGGCTSIYRTRLDATLSPGDYSVVMDGYSSSSGVYSMDMQCASTPPPTDPPTNPPTNPPTTLPPTTLPPTNPPTTLPPTTLPPNNPPTTLPTTIYRRPTRQPRCRRPTH